MASGVAVRSLAASLRAPWVKRGQSHDVALMGYLVREHLYLYLRPHGSYLVTARPLCATTAPAPSQPTTSAHPCVTACRGALPGEPGSSLAGGEVPAFALFDLR